MAIKDNSYNSETSLIESLEHMLAGQTNIPYSGKQLPNSPSEKGNSLNDLMEIINANNYFDQMLSNAQWTKAEDYKMEEILNEVPNKKDILELALADFSYMEQNQYLQPEFIDYNCLGKYEVKEENIVNQPEYLTQEYYNYNYNYNGHDQNQDQSSINLYQYERTQTSNGYSYHGNQLPNECQPFVFSSSVPVEFCNYQQPQFPDYQASEYKHHPQFQAYRELKKENFDQLSTNYPQFQAYTEPKKENFDQISANYPQFQAYREPKKEDFEQLSANYLQFQAYREPKVENFDQLSTDRSFQTTSSDSELDSPFKCEWTGCSRNFHNQSLLAFHVEEIHVRGGEPRKFVCLWESCTRHSQPFSARYKLLTHTRIHTGDKPHKCNYPNCMKGFTTVENLKIHKRSHTGEKPCICPYAGCTKAYSNSSDCKKHLRTHYNTRPYVCPDCTKSYTDPSSLRKHRKIHKVQ